MARQTTARPVPVLPLVSSTTVCPGRSSLEARASRMISRAILSFLLPPGLKYSSFTSSRPDKPRLSTLRVSSRSGVRPITSRMERAKGGQLVFIRSAPRKSGPRVSRDQAPPDARTSSRSGGRLELEREQSGHREVAHDRLGNLHINGNADRHVIGKGQAERGSQRQRRACFRNGQPLN